MGTHAAGSFEITGWEEDPALDEGGHTFTRTRVRKVFSGDLAGTSSAELIMVGVDGAPAAYAGYERFTATLGGRDGSFVLEHLAGNGPEGAHARWTILSGSGAGGLTGIRGTAQIERHEDGSHTFTLDYNLE